MREGLQAMRGSSVHATWPRLVSGHSRSFSSINSVVPRSRSPLPQAVGDAERRTGEPGDALLAGVRGENSPHYIQRPSGRKKAKTIFNAWAPLLGCRSLARVKLSYECLVRQVPVMRVHVQVTA